jgi:hypothetical protein
MACYRVTFTFCQITLQWNIFIQIRAVQSVDWIFVMKLTYLLTYSTQHSPSWEANHFAASQEIPHILWNPNFITTFTIAPHLSLSSIHPYPYVPLPEDPSLYCTPIYDQVSQAVFFPQVSAPKPRARLSPPHPCYMPHASHCSRFFHTHNIGWGVQITKLPIMKFSPIPCYLVPLMPKYFPQKGCVYRSKLTRRNFIMIPS